MATRLPSSSKKITQLRQIQVFPREPLQTLMTGSRRQLPPKKNKHQRLKKQRASQRLQRLMMSSRRQTPQMRSRPLRMDNQRMIKQQKRHPKERVHNSEESSKSNRIDLLKLQTISKSHSHQRQITADSMQDFSHSSHSTALTHSSQHSISTNFDN